MLVLAAIAFDASLAAAPSNVEVTRNLPHSVVVGSEATIGWTLLNLGSRVARLTVADTIYPSFAATRRFAVDLEPAGSATASVSITPTRRGRFSIDRMDIRSVGPLGLGARQESRVQAELLRVVPAFHSKREVELRMQRARLLDIGSRSVRAFGGGTEFDQLRDYTPDDQFRNIDWAATARSGRTIVKQFRAEQHETVLLALDNGRLMAARAGGVTRLEHAMDAVMALASVTSRIGDLSGLLTFDSEVGDVVAPSRGNRHLNRLTEEMFDLEPVLGESDYAAMAAQVLARFRRRMTVVLLTDLAPAVVDSSLAAAVRALSMRHDVVVGSVVASEVMAWVDTVPEETGEAHLVSAAAMAMQERSRAARALTAARARVVDAEAGRLGPELVDLYLTRKALGRAS